MAVLFALTACLTTVDSGVPTLATVPEVQNCTADAVLGLGASGGGVACMQFELMLLGYESPVNATFDQATADALSWYQSEHPPLRVSGSADARTLRFLGIYSGVDSSPPPLCLADAPVATGDSGDGTTCVQQTLANLGLYPGKVDGTFGPGTLLALTQFQQQHRPIPADGTAGPQTLAAMGIWSGVTRGAIVDDPTTAAPAGPWPAPFELYPEYRVNAEGIPFYGSSDVCTRADADMISYEFARDGADIGTQRWAVYIASREGGCKFDTVYVNAATRDDSHCSFQLNVLSGTFQPNGELGRRGWTVEKVKASMQDCADAASDLWVFCGRGPWTPPYSCKPPWEDINAPVA